MQKNPYLEPCDNCNETGVVSRPYPLSDRCPVCKGYKEKPNVNGEFILELIYKYSYKY